MEPKQERKIISRRARPAKAPLSREAIVSTALGLLAQDGLDGLSLRKVAAALDTGPASLYVYVSNLTDLKSQMLNHALGQVALQPVGADWHTQLRAVLHSYMDVLQAHPGLAHVAMAPILPGTNMWRILENLVALLIEGGIDTQAAAWGVDLLTLYVTAIAAEEYNRQRFGEGMGRMREALGRLEAGDFPHLVAMADALLWGLGVERFDWALEVMISGLRHAKPVRGPAVEAL